MTNGMGMALERNARGHGLKVRLPERHPGSVGLRRKLARWRQAWGMVMQQRSLQTPAA